MQYPGPCPGIRAAYPSKTSWVFEFGLRLKFRMPILMAAAAAASRNAFVGPASDPSRTIAHEYSIGSYSQAINNKASRFCHATR
ncbi:MAG: hypothetical protein QOH35_3589 [Acidobacteriaceae bacterium]|jgi:hypothetical protein|nr:hypothetical protein [Acidobacteriaceae bacterium]